MAQPSSRDFGAEMAGLPVEEVEPPTPRPRVKVGFSQEFMDAETRDDPPELLMDTMAMRPRSLSHHLRSTQVPSRKWLKMKADFWRSLMTFGMVFHNWPRPRPPKPSFVRRILTESDPIDLYFYVPRDYYRRKEVAYDRYPIVVNFHGGGFCLGHATDDRYWAAVILKHTPAVFVSVNYRRAPEHPFPQPVDDCVEALLYLQTHAEELHVDPSQIALSGFSAGGNLAFTVPFRLTYQYERQASTEHLPVAPKRTNESNWVPEPELNSRRLSPDDQHEQEMGLLTPLPNTHDTPTAKQSSPWGSSTDLHQTQTNRTNHTHDSSRTNLLNLPGPRSKLIRTITTESFRSQQSAKQTNHHEIPEIPHAPTSDTTSPIFEHDFSPRIRIVSILAWYPLIDWTSSRAQKKRGSRNPKKTLPAVFTDLFDFSYLPAPDHEGHHCSPYASPVLAPDHMIIDGLPQRIQLWLCEWDMLLAEGERFSEKLKGLGKDVKTEMIPNVPHGFDKSPNPFRDQKRINTLYERAAGHLSEVFSAAGRRATVGEGIGFGGMR